jgi:hypothetical protein
MKIVVRTVIFHFLCIIIFAGFYYKYQDNVQHKVKENESFLDYILLSTTIQAGVGISTIYPVSFPGKILMVMQQLIMIMTHVFTFYIFKL